MQPFKRDNTKKGDRFTLLQTTVNMCLVSGDYAESMKAEIWPCSSYNYVINVGIKGWMSLNKLVLRSPAKIGLNVVGL